jgi:ribosomal protein L37AE/L43A
MTVSAEKLSNNVLPIQLAHWWCPSCMVYRMVLTGPGTIQCHHCQSTIAQFKAVDPKQLVIQL